MKNYWVTRSQSIWFWWVFTTLIYISLTPLLSNQATAPTTPLNYIVGFIGLFVPYGLLSLMLFLTIPLFAGASLVVFLVLMTIINRKLNKWDLSVGKKILVIFLSLLVLTTIVDLIRFTPFYSWILFLNGMDMGAIFTGPM